MFEIGHGPPLVLIPGIQGRWEWMRPAIDALGRCHHVLTFSLDEVPVGSGTHFDAWLQETDALLDHARAKSAAVVGVSFGGIIALRYAARRPDRVAQLVLVSTPSPRWRLDATSAGYARRPRLSLPLFAVRAGFRLAPEILAARPGWPGRVGLVVTHGLRTLRFPPSPQQMAGWAREWMATDVMSDCRLVSAPTLLITGEARLDRVVPVTSSLEYLKLLPGAEHQVLKDTGHIGLISKPEAFADLVCAFTAGRPAAGDRQPALDAASFELTTDEGV